MAAILGLSRDCQQPRDCPAVASRGVEHDKHETILSLDWRYGLPAFRRWL